ncbi:hypothetical protein ACFQ1Q_12340 [Winogradskyella litorisediminis]|uniref:Lipoprotein n=1 Tax=Winogradskyella litorisediminis TaxID=1156618 RepID=A0ABW3N8S4_9FLAO
MKIKLIIILAICLCSCSSTKLNSYGINKENNFEKIKTKADFNYLKITSSDITIPNRADINPDSNGFVSDILVSQLLKLPDYIGKIIKDRKKKFKQNYSAKNTLDFKTNHTDTTVSLPELEFERSIFIENVNDKNQALKLNFNPVLIDDKMFAFKLDDAILSYSKAKTTSKYPFVTLNIIIKCSYFDKESGGIDSEKEIASQNMVIPIGINQKFKTVYNDVVLLSDPFEICGLKTIEIEITEINPYYLKLDELETNLNENSENLTDILTKLTELIKAK